jgi:signal peptidase II
MEQNIRGGRYFLPGLAIICSVILLDQYTKWLVIDALRAATAPHPGFFTWLTSGNRISYLLTEREVFDRKTLAPFLNFVMVWNQGISFGMMDNQAPHMVQILIALSLTVSAGLMLWLSLSTEKNISLALGLIIGGALGNVADRVRFDAVEDFIDFHIQHYHWPAFNVADSCIVIGAGILMLISFLSKEDPKRTP